MNVTVLWESRFAAASAEGGLEVTRKIWQDMRQYAGYVDHEIVRDLDHSGHLLVISHWRSREAADTVKNRYRAHPNAVLANKLASEPRIRWAGVSVDEGSSSGKQAA